MRARIARFWIVVIKLVENGPRMWHALQRLLYYRREWITMGCCCRAVTDSFAVSLTALQCDSAVELCDRVH